MWVECRMSFACTASAIRSLWEEEEAKEEEEEEETEEAEEEVYRQD